MYINQAALYFRNIEDLVILTIDNIGTFSRNITNFRLFLNKFGISHASLSKKCTV